MKRYEYNYGKNPEGVLSTISGYATETTNYGETAFGILNKSTRDDSNYTTPEVVSSSIATLFSVGNGTDHQNRKNIIELKADGTVYISGVGQYDGTNPGEATSIADEFQGIHDDITGVNEDIDRIDNTIESIHISEDNANLIYTLLIDGQERGTINIPRDQFLKNVSYNEETNNLEFTFIVRGENNEEVEKQVNVNMTDLEDIYSAGDGLNLENKQFSVKVDADTQPYIEVSSNGVKVVGIDEKFNTVNQNVTDLTNRVTTAESDIDAIQDALSGGTMNGSITFESEPAGNVGDAVLYDKQANKLIVVPTTDDIGTKYPSDDYEPIGVVVIPASHDVYGTGQCGVMSLKNMSVDTPDTGQIQHEGMFYGQMNINSSLPNLTDAPYVGNGYNYGDSNSTVIGNVDIQEYICYIPSDAFNTVQCPHDVTAYYHVTSDISYYAPSPYLTDGSRNPAYYQTTSPSSTSNVLADFDGAGNTTTYLDLATAQSDWKTSSSILQGSSVENGYSPAACCCWRYHTSGTQQGDWYLPACGELGYVIAKQKTINDAISKLISVYGSSFAVALFASKHYWSSTEGNYTQTFAIRCNNGRIDGHNRFANDLVRAFTRILPESNSFGIIVSGKSDQDLLNAAGGTTSISDITSQIDLTPYATKEEVGSNTYTDSNYLSKETNLTDAVLQLDEEIKATNDNLDLEHANAEATYAKKAELEDYLPVFIPTAYSALYVYGNVSEVTTTPVYSMLNVNGITLLNENYESRGSDTELFNTNGGTVSIDDIVTQVQAAIVDSAPETLDTLNELAAALGDDPNFATTVTNQIAQKADKTTATTSADGLMSTADKAKLDSIAIQDGDIIASGFRITNGTANQVLTADGDSNTLKTINGQTLLGSGNITIPTPTVNAASGTKTIWTGTQSEYDAVSTKDANTLYFITEG